MGHLGVTDFPIRDPKLYVLFIAHIHTPEISMGRVVFVYAGQPDDQRRQSPYSITRAIWSLLKEKHGNVAYYAWDYTGPIDIRADDVVVGHPNYSPLTPMQRLFRENHKCKARILIHPLHLNFVEDNWPFNDMWMACDAGLAITGPYWYDQLPNTRFAPWRERMTRLDMAVDADVYKWFKKDIGFRVEGTRELVYVGSSMPHKNLWYLADIMRAMPTVKLNWYGGSSDHSLAKLPNVTTTGWQELGDSVLRDICGRSDIFVNVSKSDANPTTLIEACALGLVAACTQESGYYNDPMFESLPLDNTPAAVAAITRLLLLPIHEMERRSAYNRAQVEQRYTWSVFRETVWGVVKKYL
jgi:glycosyltransferase involved in cell wall biosynthesis